MKSVSHKIKEKCYAHVLLVDGVAYFISEEDYDRELSNEDKVFQIELNGLATIFSQPGAEILLVEVSDAIGASLGMTDCDCFSYWAPFEVDAIGPDFFVENDCVYRFNYAWDRQAKAALQARLAREEAAQIEAAITPAQNKNKTGGRL